ncbi:hypothetical protein SEVIR_4G169700v4 [Setaria viridis]|uniref:Uncharacterized protein n=1 Tax=Setaria italica TaxID=4555 RepID=A0A368QUM5_SETIT|nr:hypothetical protein SETIT_4G143300v2 [Setaria italica]
MITRQIGGCGNLRSYNEKKFGQPWQTSALNWIIKSLDVFRLKVDAWLAYHTQGTYRDVIGILLKLKRLTNRHPSCYSSACWMATGNWDSGAGRHAELYIRV